MSPAQKECDVLGLGCTAVDDILYVHAYPTADTKVEVRLRERHCGGLTSTALVAAARLGAKCAFAGSLGGDDDSRFVLQTLRREGVNLKHLVRRDQARPVRSVIIVDERKRTRNIFFSTAQVLGADATLPSEKVILGARVLLVDRFGIPGMIRAARIARRAGLPVVGDFESSGYPRFAELLALTDHLILSASFARQLTGRRTPAAAAASLWRKDRGAVVVTCGAEGCWFLDPARSKAEPLPAYRVKAVDTTGCGDVFHGAYAAALARALPLAERVRFAAAAAALKATRHGGQAGIPRLADVEHFLENHRS